jgi:hypothetical protein
MVSASNHRRRRNWFVNWADFPSMVALPDGSLAAHWLVKSGTGTYAYDINISRSFDGGKTWGKPFVPHRDGTQTEHGFVTMFAARDGSLAAVWLDGREMKGHETGHGHGNMTLRYVKIKRDGALADEAVLDAKVCECCQTSAAMTGDGPAIVHSTSKTGLLRRFRRDLRRAGHCGRRLSRGPRGCSVARRRERDGLLAGETARRR